MTANEFTEHYTRFLQAQRDFPGLDHRGHFDGAINARWKTVLHDRKHKFEQHPSTAMQRIRRDFERTA